MSIKFKDFTNLYQISKTLRFELKPIGPTSDNLDKIIAEDSQRSVNYKKLKPLIDEFHDDFINKSLYDAEGLRPSFLQLGTEIEEFSLCQIDSQKYEKLSQSIDKTQKELRSEISNLFAKKAGYDAEDQAMSNNGMAIINNPGAMVEYLAKLWHNNPQKSELIKSFDKFTTYFVGFCENRSNYYSNEAKATSIANRTVNENFTKFTNNRKIVFSNIFKESFINWFNQEHRFIEDSQTKNKVITKIELDKFSYESYVYYLNQLGIENYNILVGNVNYWINQYNQVTKPKIKLKRLVKLYKQIGQIPSDKTNLFKYYEQDDELIADLINLTTKTAEYNNKAKFIINNLLNGIYDNAGIHLNKQSVTVLSSKHFSNWHAVSDLLVKSKIYTRSKIDNKAIIKETSLSQLENNLKNLVASEVIKSHNYYDHINDDNAYIALIKVIAESINTESKISEELSSKIDTDIDLLNQHHKDLIKNYLDSLFNIHRTLKMFVPKVAVNIDTEFYDDLTEALESIEIDSIYNATRNYLTKKPWDDKQKIKLNFENPVLASGWDKNKESSNYTILLRKDQTYYLAIMQKGRSDLFTDKHINEYTGYGYEKMTYKLLPGASKMLPKVFFSKLNIHEFNPSQEILQIRNQASHTKNGKPQNGFQKKDFNLTDCHKMIDFYKKSIRTHKDWQYFPFNFKETKKYQDISEFYKDVENGGYTLKWESVSGDYVTEKLNNNELYLFEIKNKDSGSLAIGAKNMHTLYWHNIFFSDTNFKLSGGAELFFRPKSIEKTIKQPNKLKPHIISHNRYTENKYFFHCPFVINRTANSATNKALNLYVNKQLAKDTNIIGIDRGEKNLEYYCVLNGDGEIIEQGSLNKFANTDYIALLEERSNIRDNARKNWKVIENIKDIKNGHTSLAIKKIADLAVKYNALIILEDLNAGFMRGRQKIEKSVYQKFELALAKKLNYYVDKNITDGPANPNQGLQLTAEVNNFSDIERYKQTGIMFYVRANYTSTTDPVTGWRKNLYLKINNDSKNDIKKFKKIYYDISLDSFVFTYNAIDFNNNALNKTWSIQSCVDRFRGSKNSNGIWEKKPIYCTKEIKKLLDQYNINYSNGDNLINEIASADPKLSKDIIYYLNIIMQIRNSGIQKQDDDFIHSPVYPFFDSRKQLIKINYNETIPNNSKLPVSGDSNGAYNIARKGQMLISRIMANPDKPDLFISDTDWDKFTTKNER